MGTNDIFATTARSIRALEDKLRPDLKWQKVEDIPDFPFQSFAETQKELSAENEYLFGIDAGLARKLSTRTYGRPYALFVAVLFFTPAILALFATVSGVVKGRYILLVCVPAVLVGYIFGSPHRSRFVAFIPFGLFSCGWIWAIWSGYGSVAWIAGLIALSILIMHGVNDLNLNKGKKVALHSEVIFLELYRNGHISIWDKKRANIYSCKLAEMEDDIYSIVPDLDERLARIKANRPKEPTE
jgi:hypothetical protein